MDTHSRSFAKALSWRVTGTIDTLIISLVVTGSVKLRRSHRHDRGLHQVAALLSP